MTTQSLAFWCALLLTLVSPQLAAQHGRVFVFRHANVIPMNEEIVLRDYDVVVQDGTIIEIGPSSSDPIPKEATTISASGQYLIPGLSDMHVHLEGDAWNIMFPQDKKYTSDEINFDDILFLYLAHGITTIDVLFAFPEHIILRERIREHELLGPRLILSRAIDGAGKAWPPPLVTWISNAQEAEAAVREAHQQGYDRIKVYSFLEKDAYDTIIKTASRLGIPVDGHIPFSTSPEYIIAAGQRNVAHVEEVMKFATEYTPQQIEYYATLFSQSNTWVTTALVLNRNLNNLLRDPEGELSKPGTDLLHPMGLGIWNYVYEHIYKPIPEPNQQIMRSGYVLFQKPFTRELFMKGGKLLSGTDALVPSTLPGISLHDELGELVDAGLTPFEALKISTTNAFEFLGESDRAGTIESGKIATLVLLDDNPLFNIANTKRISGVMTQGRWIPRSEIEERLSRIRDSYARLRELKSH